MAYNYSIRHVFSPLISSSEVHKNVSKICVKNILRIFQAHFRENVKNTEPGRKFHHSYKKSVYEKLYCSRCCHHRFKNDCCNSTCRCSLSHNLVITSHTRGITWWRVPPERYHLVMPEINWWYYFMHTSLIHHRVMRLCHQGTWKYHFYP